MAQYYLNPEHYEKDMELLLRQLEIEHILLVCGKSFYHLPIYSFFEKLWKSKGIAVTYFNDFSSNPKYSDFPKPRIK